MLSSAAEMTLGAGAQMLRSVSRKTTLMRYERLATLDISAAVLLLGSAIALPVFTFMTVYSISDRAFAQMPPEKRWPKGYFLSAALDLPPATNFGAFFLTISFASATGVSIVRHMVVARRLPAGSAALHRTSLGLALVATLGGNGVAAYPHHSSRLVHNLAAAIFFLGNLFHFLLEALLEQREPLGVRAGQQAARFWHGVICALAAGCTLTFLAHVVGEEMNGWDLHIGKLVAALAEITTVGCFLIYMGTYYRSFTATRLHFSISIDGDVSDPAWSDLRREPSWDEMRKHAFSASSPPRAPSLVKSDSTDSMLDAVLGTAETIAAETLAPFLSAPQRARFDDTEQRVQDGEDGVEVQEGVLVDGEEAGHGEDHEARGPDPGDSM